MTPYKRVFYGTVNIYEQEGGYCSPCIEVTPDNPDESKVIEDEILRDLGGSPQGKYRITIERLT